MITEFLLYVQVRSVGNTLTLHETALIEAFNLRAAIEYVLKNNENAREALTDMPPRSEDELDAVTLHNQVPAFEGQREPGELGATALGGSID